MHYLPRLSPRFSQNDMYKDKNTAIVSSKFIASHDSRHHPTGQHDTHGKPQQQSILNTSLKTTPSTNHRQPQSAQPQPPQPSPICGVLFQLTFILQRPEPG